jgi:hypothetical protein
VDFAKAFACPHCSAIIVVSERYQRMVAWLVAILAAVISYVFGFNLWVVVLLWIPVMLFLFFLWYYVIKYWIPPPLVKFVARDSSILGLRL